MKIYRYPDGNIPLSRRNPTANTMKPGCSRDESMVVLGKNSHT